MFSLKHHIRKKRFQSDVDPEKTPKSVYKIYYQLFCSVISNKYFDFSTLYTTCPVLFHKEETMVSSCNLFLSAPQWNHGHISEFVQVKYLPVQR